MRCSFESWPKDIRGERSFVEGQIQYWVNHRNMHRDAVKSKKRRVENMDPAHPEESPSKRRNLPRMENVTLPMAEQELDQLRAFLNTYDKIEQRKLAWYKLSKGDPNFQPSEAEFLVQYKPEQPVTVRDIAVWKAEEYKASLEKKNQYELLDEAYQRFKKEPKRFPYWLQYMVVHFSGMRYASAHGSWADPKDLLIRLGAADVDKKAKALDDAAVEKLCAEKIAAYETGTGSNVPKLARATEKEWKDKVAMHMLSVKANGPKTRRAGITALLAEEANYDEPFPFHRRGVEKTRRHEIQIPSVGVEGNRQTHAVARQPCHRPELGKTDSRRGNRTQLTGSRWKSAW